MGLQQLPHELLSNISERLTSTRDLASFCLVSKKVHAAALPALYRSIKLTVDEKHLERYEPKEIGAARERRYLDHAKSLTLKAPFRDNLELRRRCFHFDSFNSSFFPISTSKDQTKAIEDRIASNLLPVFEACKEGSLHDFSWDLWMCVPTAILGQGGYLNTHQKALKSIRLFTYEHCSQKKDGITFAGLDLQAFPNLKRLSWAGLFEDGLDGLASVLESVAPQLTSLDLDFFMYTPPRPPINYDSDSDDDERHRRFMSAMWPPQQRTILTIPAPQQPPPPPRIPDDSSFSILSRAFRLHKPTPLSFPALRDFSLSGTEVEPGDVEGIMNAMDFYRLRNLQLRFCTGSELILERLAASPLPVNLRSFALQEYDVSYDGSPTRIIPFLESFEGLEDLFLSIPANQEAATDIWAAAAGRHRKTLRRFVYHQRLLKGDDDNTAPEDCQDWDQTDFSMGEPTDLKNGPGEGNPLGSLDLESLGLACSPEWMTRLVSPFCHKTSLQLLHMRRSGPEFERMRPGRRRKRYNPLDETTWGSDDDDYDDDEDYDNDYHGDYDQFDEDGNISDQSFGMSFGGGSDGPAEYGRRPDSEPDRAGKSSKPIGDQGPLPADLHNFLQWVFGPDGIRSLRLFLYGDFSYNGRYKDDCKMICRNEETQTEDYGAVQGNEPPLYYREVTEADRGLFNLLEEHNDLVTACPLTILEK